VRGYRPRAVCPPFGFPKQAIPYRRHASQPPPPPALSSIHPSIHPSQSIESRGLFHADGRATSCSSLSRALTLRCLPRLMLSFPPRRLRFHLGYRRPSWARGLPRFLVEPPFLCHKPPSPPQKKSASLRPPTSTTPSDSTFDSYMAALFAATRHLPSRVTQLAVSPRDNVWNRISCMQESCHGEASVVCMELWHVFFCLRYAAQSSCTHGLAPSCVSAKYTHSETCSTR